MIASVYYSIYLGQTGTNFHALVELFGPIIHIDSLDFNDVNFDLGKYTIRSYITKKTALLEKGRIINQVYMESFLNKFEFERCTKKTLRHDVEAIGDDLCKLHGFNYQSTKLIEATMINPHERAWMMHSFICDCGNVRNPADFCNANGILPDQIQFLGTSILRDGTTQIYNCMLYWPQNKPLPK